MKLKRRGKGGQPSLLPRVLFLALFFLAGILLGQVFAARVPSVAGQELTDYLNHYMELDGCVSLRTALSTCFLYVRYPLLAMLLGFASIGVVFLPGITAAFGFFLSFSVSCFTAAFGPDGVLLALSMFGIRCAVTLPCYFTLAVPSWENSAMLASLSFGRGRRTAPVTYGRAWWRRIAVCLIVLLFGICVDLACAPWFLRLALSRILS